MEGTHEASTLTVAIISFIYSSTGKEWTHITLHCGTLTYSHWKCSWAISM